MTSATTATSMIGSASSATNLGPSVFLFLNMQQFIWAIILVGDIDNDYLINFFQAGLNLDQDLIPPEYMP